MRLSQLAISHPHTFHQHIWTRSFHTLKTEIQKDKGIIINQYEYGSLCCEQAERS